jgi:hypothetical protein
LKQRTGWIVLAFLAGATAVTHAQLAPITVPRGVFRIELGGEFRNSDSRYNDGTTEDLARGFTAIPLGSTFFPTLSASEARLGAILGNASYRISLGQSTANGLMNIGTATIGVSYGLTSRITLFTSVPIVRTRMQLSFRLDSTGADTGINPNDPVLGTQAGRIQTTAFFSELDGVLATLASNIANGVYDANPQQLALAQQTLADGTSLRSGFAVVLNDRDAPFVPTAAGSTGTAILDSVSSFRNTLAGLGVSGFVTDPALATSALSQDEFNNLLIQPGGPVAGFPLDDAELSLLGDIEGGVSYLLADNWYRNGIPGGFRAALTGTLRFPTGELDRPENFLDIGTGTGHFAARLGGTVDLGRGRFGSRMTASYEHSFAAVIERRVGGPAQPIPFASSLRDVRRTPGGLLDLSIAPFFRLGSTLGITSGVRYRRHSLDKVSFASGNDSLPGGIDPSILAQSTDWSVTSFLAGVTYMSPAAADLARPGFPVEASWTVEGPLSGSGGIIAKERIMRVQFRMYMRL